MDKTVIRLALDADDAALLLAALDELGRAAADYERLKDSVRLAARIRQQGRVFGLDWLERNP